MARKTNTEGTDFIKFPSIDNHYETGSTNKWIQRFPELQCSKFIISEKLDGSNIQLIISKNDIQVATRNNLLEVTDTFFDYHNTILKQYSENIKKLQRLINKTDGLDKPIRGF